MEYKTGKLYQIGMPVERLSTVFMLWSAYERPGKILVYPAKTDDWAVVELRDTRLAADIVETVKEAMVKEVDKPVKMIQI